MTLAFALFQQAVAAAEPQPPLTWHNFCAQLPKTSSGTANGVKYLVEVNSVIDVLFIQAADPAPRERELLSFRIMNNNLTLQSHGNYLFGVNVYEVMRKHKTKSDLLKYLFQLIQDYAGGTTNAEAAAEPESDRAPGLNALIKRSTTDQERVRANTKRVPGGWFVGVGSHTFSDGKVGLLIYVTDEDRRGYWSFIVRALPAKYMLQFLGLGHRDRMKPDVTKDAAWRVVLNGDLGDLDTPADTLLNRALAAAIDYVRRNEDRPEYQAIVRAAAEPEATGNGMSTSAAARRYTKFLGDAVAEYVRKHLSDRQYWVKDKSKRKVFGIGIHYKSTPTVSKAFVFAPFEYDTRADHVGVGYYAVQDLGAAHNITVLHVQDGEVRGRFSVPVPVLGHVFVREAVTNADAGKAAVVGLRVNAVLNAIWRDIARARAAAGHTNTPEGPVHLYDLNDFHYRGSSFRPDEAAE